MRNRAARYALPRPDGDRPAGWQGLTELGWWEGAGVGTGTGGGGAPRCLRSGSGCCSWQPGMEMLSQRRPRPCDGEKLARHQPGDAGRRRAVLEISALPALHRGVGGGATQHTQSGTIQPRCRMFNKNTDMAQLAM